jgi:hypothetical protein
VYNIFSLSFVLPRFPSLGFSFLYFPGENTSHSDYNAITLLQLHPSALFDFDGILKAEKQRTSSREFFPQLLGVIMSPLFIFLLCNVIIVTLLAKSG